MKKGLEKQIDIIIKNKSKMKKSLYNYETASKEYEKLVAQGLATNRGHNIMTINEIYTSYSCSENINKNQ